jgi:hypothetical protein
MTNVGMSYPALTDDRGSAGAAATAGRRMRIVTRGDMDGLACALVASLCEPIQSVELVHPQEIADRNFPVTSADIIANLPYHPSCGKWFDNHQLTDETAMPPKGFEGKWGLAPSAARLVYEHYLPRHPDLRRFEPLIAATDRLDSARLTRDDVVSPTGFILLGYTLDPRTGLGAFREYFLTLLSSLKTKPLAEVLALPAVKERIERLRDQDQAFREATLACSKQEGNVVFTDFRATSPIPAGNRFLVYTLYPEANVSVRAHWGPRRERVAVSIGHSIFDRTCQTNVGILMSLYGGGGHKGAGGCMLMPEKADALIAQMIERLRDKG